MNLYRRGPTSPWYVNIRLADGTRQRTSTKRTDRRGAEAEARALQAKVDASAALDQDGKRAITLEAAMGLYVGALVSGRKVSAPGASSLRDKTLGAGVWASKPLHRIPTTLFLHDLSATHLEGLKQARLKEGNSAQTVKHELAVIRAASRYAHGLNYRTAALANWRMPATPTKTRYLSWDEFKAVYAAMDPDRAFRRPLKSGALSRAAPHGGTPRQRMLDARDLLVALAMCGGRWGEVAALTWDRVDMEGRTLRIYATKGNHGERHIAIPDMFAEVLERRSAERDPRQPLVFPGPRNAEQRKKPTRAIARAMAKAGMNRPDIVARYGRASVHSLRHTFASLLLQGGADLSEVQDSLGHTSIAMTRRYAHLSKGKTLSKLGGIMNALGGAG